KVIDDKLIVNDLVIAVDGRLKDARHPVERFNGLFDAGTKAPRSGEHNLVNRHSASLVTGLLAQCLGCTGVRSPYFVYLSGFAGFWRRSRSGRRARERQWRDPYRHHRVSAVN